ncbi:Concanavalin A-like lectin/glucanases superfamily protein [Salinimicrobium sediminis]|uniref:Concanavalin A-like lectin/glucanases superfamily protein n=1 Tax=Salinimicrobium sediminis TaxID=1343891 RepID=A0A285X3I7_9FLAO|nr:LamG-like jellyroll fold domain-containing protein [Salinimicrobium sediminis]SOC79314.1 Concanavalin A-like lectin/glucanases superfamily protein [Salinimicrobium sediminis]
MRGISLFLLVLFIASCEGPDQEEVVWKIDNIREIGGNTVTVHGEPKFVEGEGTNYVEFNGKKDGLLIYANPISAMEEFTIEVDFKPYPGFPENREQRFLHIQDPENENRRILIELRLTDQNEWYGDWFIKSENESLTLIDSTHTHPLNQWFTISMVYSNGNIRGYVNGKEEVSGNFQYLPIGENAKTSLGTRMDKRSWFKGGISEVRFTPEADF